MDDIKLGGIANTANPKILCQEQHEVNKERSPPTIGSKAIFMPDQDGNTQKPPPLAALARNSGSRRPRASGDPGLVATVQDHLTCP